MSSWVGISMHRPYFVRSLGVFCSSQLESMLLISFELVNSDVADLQYCRCFQKRVSFLLPLLTRSCAQSHKN
ncbi:hypothetical protein CLOM_g14561 [Closterium sp. NIES-68]|nr:hypothetical protein CLOM_g14561 [Closterium sp. NIES-68]